MSFTTNPRHPNNPAEGGREATGQVASDSLAAESAQSGGAFSANDADISSVKGSNSTLANTDTSGATVLAPARDGAAREDGTDKGMGSDERGTTGENYDATEAVTTGTTSLDGGFRGGPSSEKYESGGSKEFGGNTKAGRETAAGDSGDSFADNAAPQGTSGVDSNTKSGSAAASGSGSTTTGGAGSGSSNTTSGAGAGASASGSGGSGGSSGLSTSAGDSSTSARNPERNTSDNTVNDASVSTTTGSRKTDSEGRSGDASQGDEAPTYASQFRSEGELQPKGSNLTEGDIPQTKTFTGNVGGASDPGRLAEQEFTKIGSGGSVNAGNPSYGEKGTEGTVGGQYSVLESERAPDVEQ